MLLVVAWDGADFDLIDTWVRRGDLPNLCALIGDGARRRVRSTMPAVTFPAWTSFMTAASPDLHGVTDFTVRREGRYAVSFVNSSYRRLPTAWSLFSSAGLRVGVYALPATYPAEVLNGIQVCGFDTPMGAGYGRGFTFPGDLVGRLHERYGDVAVGSPQQARIDEDWYEDARASMLETIRLRTRIVSDLLSEDSFDVFMVHYGESDTVSHHFWQYHDPGSPRHRAGGPADAVFEIYRELDSSLGRLMETVGGVSDLMLISDHGSGGSSDRAVYWNRWLATSGFLSFAGASLAGLTGRAAKELALRVLPTRLQAGLFSRLQSAAGSVESMSRFSGIDWAKTRAYSEELNYFPSIWLNIKGREPEGIVEPKDRYRLEEDIIAALGEFEDPFDGERVVRRVLRREEVYEGPYAGRIPDLILELAEPDGYSYAGCSSRGGAESASVRKLTAREMSGQRGTSMSGAHRPFGMCVLSGPSVRPGSYDDADLHDAGATMMALARVAPPEHANGRPWDDVLAVGGAGLRQPSYDLPGCPAPSSSADEAELASRLRSLGYLE